MVVLHHTRSYQYCILHTNGKISSLRITFKGIYTIIFRSETLLGRVEPNLMVRWVAYHQNLNIQPVVNMNMETVRNLNI